MAAVTSDRDSALLRGLRALEVLAASDRALPLSAVADALGLPRPTVHRILRQLAVAGFLAQEPADRNYMLARRTARLAVDAMRHGARQAGRRAILERLVADLNETCNITMLDGAEVVYVDRVESQWPLQMTLQPGSRVPLHCTASGKLFFALLPARTRKRLLATLPLERRTARTLVEPALLEAEFARIREARFGTDNEEFLDGLVAASVPVMDAAGRPIAAVAVHGPVGRLSFDRALSLVPRLRQAADELAEAFEVD
ncbi:MAG: IclR family transcriptional regulator [Rhodocyclaceae bacterium]|jgi:IclR family acetate operon transcriptional repressor|nr:IclR family transcriptional regulator [Rhodocyclaceae bacterium]MCE2980644.1 IclR family transcriptional regulator [Betaproteobacteria bacterium]MCA3093420.1 IclR family transcriptional regulator [Rhodocyclaceae bacterium]MCA3096237.1 IclR family transcriptional regulator [Rhodocyclaceae bacterium]MCA3101316.1 IclR family transcriptional regulator [Rhodocyclaceae bacterium]